MFCVCLAIGVHTIFKLLQTIVVTFVTDIHSPVMATPVILHIRQLKISMVVTVKWAWQIAIRQITKNTGKHIPLLVFPSSALRGARNMGLSKFYNTLQIVERAATNRYNTWIYLSNDNKQPMHTHENLYTCTRTFTYCCLVRWKGIYLMKWSTVVKWRLWLKLVSVLPSKWLW